MKKAEQTLEEKGRYDAYSGETGFTYHHHVSKGYPCDTNIWHYLKDVQAVEFRQTVGVVSEASIDPNDVSALKARTAELQAAAKYIKRMTELKEFWTPLSNGLLSKLLGKVVSLQALPRNSGVYALRADETSDDLSWGPGSWAVGMIGARKTRDTLTLDIRLSDVLMQDDNTRQEAYGFAAGAVAMKCISYDRGGTHPLRGVLVKPDPDMEHPFCEFDYVLEMLKRDQQADIAALGRISGAARQAGLTAVKAVHDEELASLS